MLQSIPGHRKNATWTRTLGREANLGRAGERRKAARDVDMLPPTANHTPRGFGEDGGKKRRIGGAEGVCFVLGVVGGCLCLKDRVAVYGAMRCNCGKKACFSEASA